jgi:hypothetical protein
MQHTKSKMHDDASGRFPASYGVVSIQSAASMPVESIFSSWKKYLTGFVHLLLIPEALVFFSTSGYATEIYRWVDEAGKTHMSDVVPEKYRATAKSVNSRKYELSDSERKDAEARAAKLKSPIVREKVEPVAEPDVVDVPKPLETGPHSTCAQKWDAYYQSQDCFAPFFIRTGQGSFLKPEAYDVCQVVETPAMACEYDKRGVRK